MKRLLNLTIIFLIIFSSSVSVSAGDISFSVSGMDYVSGTPLADWGDSIRLYTGNRVSYNVDFPEAGMYKLAVKAAEQVNNIMSTLGVSVNGVNVGKGEVSSSTVSNTGNNRNWESFDIATFYVETSGISVVELSMIEGNIALACFDISIIVENGWELTINGVDYDGGAPLDNWGDSIRFYNGNRVSYNIDFPVAGAYSLSVVAAEQVNDIVSNLDILVNGVKVGFGEISTTRVENIGNNHKWEKFDITSFFIKEPGVAVLELYVPMGNIALKNFTVRMVDEFTVEAENYTESSDVITKNLSDTNSAVIMKTGDRIVFDATVSKDGIYSISSVVSCLSDCILSIKNEEKELGTYTVSSGGGWTDYKTTELGLCTLNNGNHTFELYVDEGEIFFDKIIFQKGEGTTLEVTQNNDGINCILRNFDSKETEGKIIYALYDSGGNLKEYKVSDDSIAIKQEEKAKISHRFVGASDGDYSKVFYWSNQKELLPLTRSGQTQIILKNPNPSMQIYVDKNGNDNNDGSIDSPFATIERALEKVSEINEHMDGNIEVCINPGSYYIDETINITSEHSGKNGYDVIIKATDEDNLPLVHGGVRVTGWTKGDNGIWSAPFDAVDDVRNLYINGYAAQRARSSYLYKANEYYKSEDSEYSDDGVIVGTGAFPQDITCPEDVETIWDIAWTSSHIPVKDIIYSEENVTLIFDQPYYSYIRKESNTMVKTGERFYLENDLSLLDEKGEFYFDKQRKRLYYLPFDEEDLTSADVYVPSTEGIVKISGTSDSYAENIILRNIEFRYGAWNDVSIYGLRDTQADGIDIDNSSVMMPAQIDVLYADNIDIEECIISSMGSAAIAMTNAVTNSSVKGCVITDCSATAIILGHWRHKSTLPEGYVRCTDNRVTDNIIRRCGTEYKGSCGITAYYVKDTDISHNDLKTLPYTGISLGWGWGTELVPECMNNEISYNRVTDVMTALSDGGHIYTLGHLRNTAIYGNVLSGSGDFRGGIYTDNGSRYLTIRDNIVKDSANWLYTYDPTLTGILVYNNYSDTQSYINNSSSGVRMINNSLLDGSDRQNMIESEAGARNVEEILINTAEYPSWRTNFIETVPDRVYAAYPEGTIQAEDFVQGSPTEFTKTYVTLYPSTVSDDYVTYDVDLPAGYYSIKTIGSLQQEYNSVVGIYLDDRKVAECSVTPTGSWNKFAESSTDSFIVWSGGKSKLTVKMLQGYYMMDYLVITKR